AGAGLAPRARPRGSADPAPPPCRTSSAGTAGGPGPDHGRAPDRGRPPRRRPIARPGTTGATSTTACHRIRTAAPAPARPPFIPALLLRLPPVRHVGPLHRPILVEVHQRVPLVALLVPALPPVAADRPVPEV